MSAAVRSATESRAPTQSAEPAMTDLAFIGVTILVFAVLALIAKGVERL